MAKLSAEEMIARYVYDVVRRLPQKSREDISRELESLIRDMLGDSYGESDVERVLNELGSPAELAGKYREDERALISGEYYDKYIFLLKIVLWCVGLGMCVANVVGLIAEPPEQIWLGVAEFFSNLFYGLITAFAFVTLLFIVFERVGVKMDFDAWNAKDLPPIPQDNALIKRGDSIAGIVFTVAGLLLLNLAAQYIAVYNSSGEIVAQVFDMDALYSVLPLLNVCFIIGIAKEAARVIAGRHTLRLAALTCVMDIVSLVITLYVFLNVGIFNTGLMNELRASGFVDANAGMDFIDGLMGNLNLIFAGLAAFATVLDMATSLYKGIRYGRNA